MCSMRHCKAAAFSVRLLLCVLFERMLSLLILFSAARRNRCVPRRKKAPVRWCQQRPSPCQAPGRRRFELKFSRSRRGVGVSGADSPWRCHVTPWHKELLRVMLLSWRWWGARGFDGFPNPPQPFANTVSASSACLAFGLSQQLRAPTQTNPSGGRKDQRWIC